MTNKDLQIKNLQLENHHLKMDNTVMTKARKQFIELVDENYYIKETNKELGNKLNWIIEAITTVESEYKLKQHIPNERIVSKHKLECIHEIRKQCELIKLREEGGTL